MARDPARELVAPRQQLTVPRSFGLPGDVCWIQPLTVTAFMGLRAAEVQHHFAVALQRVIARSYMEADSLPTISVALGLEEQRLARLLRGHYRMGLRDLQAIEGVFGPILVRLDFDRVAIEDEALQRRFHLDSARSTWQG